MRHVILMPDLGQTTSEAKVLHWHKELGDRITKGEALVEVETDKVDMDVECFVDGYLRETLVAEEEMAVALEPVAIITDLPDEEYEALSREPAEAPSTDQDAAPPDEPPNAESIRRKGAVVAAPAARKRAAELNVDLVRVAGSGPNGMVTRKDVERFHADGAEGAAEGRAERSRAAMAQLVSRSKREIPHFYIHRQIVAPAVAGWRDSWNQRRPENKLSWNDIFVRAASFALQDVPEMNRRLTGDRCESHESPDVLVTVASEGGLVLVQAAAPARKDLNAFLLEMRAALAKQGRMAAAHGGEPPCVAVSNLGMYNVDDFTAIIPPGCSAILAVGKIAPAAVVRRDTIEALPVCRVTLSADHRIADGVTAARFLDRLDHHLNSRDVWE